MDGCGWPWSGLCHGELPPAPCTLSPPPLWRWQDEQLRTLVRQFGQQDWKFLASHFPVSAALPPPPPPATALLGQTCCQAEGKGSSSAPPAPRPFLPKLELQAPCLWPQGSAVAAGHPWLAACLLFSL